MSRAAGPSGKYTGPSGKYNWYHSIEEVARGAASGTRYPEPHMQALNRWDPARNKYKNVNYKLSAIDGGTMLTIIEDDTGSPKKIGILFYAN